MRTSTFLRASILCVILFFGFMISRVILQEAPGVLADSPRLQQTPSSSDANQPIPLPSRTEPAPDRTSLDDPTLAASAAAATAAPIPPRTRKAPFLKLTKPDPYEGRRTGVPLPEESMDFPFGCPLTPQR